MCDPTETAPGSGWRGWNTMRRTAADEGSRPAELLFLPLNIVGGDGAPARVLGRAIRD